MKIVVSGAGAAAIACAKLYVSFGARTKNIVMLDSKGVIQKNREDLTREKLNLLQNRPKNTGRGYYWCRVYWFVTT